MTPEQGAVELLRRLNHGVYVTCDRRPDFEMLDQHQARLSSGETAVVNFALDLWRSTGAIGEVTRQLDREHQAAVLGILSAVWLGEE